MDEKKDESRSIKLATLAENAERYEDMAKEMKTFVEESKGRLANSERNLLSVAYKNVIGKRRSAWRVVCAAKEAANEETKSIYEDYEKCIEKELRDICKEVIDLLDNKLIKKETLDVTDKDIVEEYVFYVKMKGDYYRYLCELKGEEEAWKGNISSASEAYEEARDAAKDLIPTNPIRLGLILNYSVFCYEIKNDSQKACAEAKQAFDDAIAQLDELTEDCYKDSTLIMQLLRDNLTLWTSDAQGGEEEEDN